MQILYTGKPGKLVATGGQEIPIPQDKMVVILDHKSKGVPSSTGKMALLENTGGWQLIDPVGHPDLKMNLVLGRKLPGGGRLEERPSNVEIVGQSETPYSDRGTENPQ